MNPLFFFQNSLFNAKRIKEIFLYDWMQQSDKSDYYIDDVISEMDLSCLRFCCNNQITLSCCCSKVVTLVSVVIISSGTGLWRSLSQTFGGGGAK